MVTNDSVEKTCDEVSSYSDDRMMAEFDRFFQEQPAVCDFIVELTSESSVQIQELSLFLSYMVYKTVQVEFPGAASPITVERIEEAYHDAEQWIDRLSREEEEARESRMEIEADSEPHLTRYVISELNQPLEDGSALGDEDKGEVFFVLKTVISSFSRSPFGQKTSN